MICEICGAVFEPAASRGQRRKHCSTKCNKRANVLRYSEENARIRARYRVEPVKQEKKMKTVERNAKVLAWVQARQGQLFNADDLARAMGMSVRTVYRHIDALRSTGHNIAGESGVGYVYKS